ncbi:MAG TPA: Ig-like domain repeat protein [Solirubrobacteraceae bacterium]|jgi:hypothetical protein
MQTTPRTARRGLLACLLLAAGCGTLAVAAAAEAAPWEVMPSPAGGGLQGVSCVSNRDCTAVGDLGGDPLVAHYEYDGGKWAEQSMTEAGGFNAVSCPAGSVHFSDASGPIDGCEEVNIEPLSGTAQCEVSYASVRHETILAEYSGSGSFLPSSTSEDLAVDQQPTAATLAVSSNPTAGQAITYTLSVSPGPDGGRAAFSDGGNAIAGCAAKALTGGVATCEVTYGQAGSHEIEAVYSGDADYAPASAAASANVQAPAKATATSTEVTAVPTSPTSGGLVQYTASVSPTPDGGAVSFSEDGKPLARCAAQPVAHSEGVASCVVTAGSAGTHAIEATYSGDILFGPSSGSASVFVGSGGGGGQQNSTPPDADTGSPELVSASGATLTGLVNARGTDTTYHFEYGETTSYGQSTSEVDAGTIEGIFANVTLSGLTPSTSYHFRLVARNSLGVSDGTDGTFTTISQQVQGAPNVELHTVTNKPANSQQHTLAYVLFQALVQSPLAGSVHIVAQLADGSGSPVSSQNASFAIAPNWVAAPAIRLQVKPSELLGGPALHRARGRDRCGRNG